MTVKFSRDEKFMTDCIDNRKGNFDLFSTFRHVLVAFSEDDRIYKWFRQSENIYRFVDAWRYGYEIEEKKYAIRLVAIDNTRYENLYFVKKPLGGVKEWRTRYAKNVNDLKYVYRDHYEKAFFTEEEIKKIDVNFLNFKEEVPKEWDLREEVPEDE